MGTPPGWFALHVEGELSAADAARVKLVPARDAGSGWWIDACSFRWLRLHDGVSDRPAVHRCAGARNLNAGTSEVMKVIIRQVARFVTLPAAQHRERSIRSAGSPCSRINHHTLQ